MRKGIIKILVFISVYILLVLLDSYITINGDKVIFRYIAVFSLMFFIDKEVDKLKK